MTKSNPLNEIESRFNRLNESEQMDEDAMSLEEAYDTLLEDYCFSPVKLIEHC